jgi:hypothetical protein
MQPKQKKSPSYTTTYLPRIQTHTQKKDKNDFIIDTIEYEEENNNDD